MLCPAARHGGPANGDIAPKTALQPFSKDPSPARRHRLSPPLVPSATVQDPHGALSCQRSNLSGTPPALESSPPYPSCRRPGPGAERRAWESVEQSLRSGARSSSLRALGTGKTLTHSTVICSNPPQPLPPLAPCPTRAGKAGSGGKVGGQVQARPAAQPPGGLRGGARAGPAHREGWGCRASPDGWGELRVCSSVFVCGPCPGRRCDSVGSRDPLTAQEGGVETTRSAQRLTLSKVAREPVLDTLVQILARCDITVLQEVVDSTGSAILLLLRELNRFDDSGPYSFLSSHLLGRGTYKERYVYIYRSHKAQVLDSYVYDDQNDLFAREPFVCRFSLPSKVLPSLVLVPLHTTPKAVETELNALYHVFLDASQRWQSEDVILLGDFNADCASLTKKRLDDLVLRTQAGFHWAIPDGVDTTVRASTHCTYDRIVLHGQHLQNMLRGAAAFDFPRSFGLTEEEALNISDHYPVEVELSCAVHGAQTLSLAALLLSLLLLLSPQLGLVA
ncbi:deoxyribonuclease-1-like 1 [Monodon monoceros]|uniref:deoxyribonuclease-1-like 1 n=1 Tax=Monodon monoceros TaxID=40151 RepID=UPI0010F82DC4|nr:deoxyribonuclease-1-like 1 [Monodon monoceros]